MLPTGSQAALPILASRFLGSIHSVAFLRALISWAREYARAVDVSYQGKGEQRDKHELALEGFPLLPVSE